MKIRWLGHSAVEILYRGKKILIDPFIEKSEGLDLKPDLICVTHGHSDHLGSTIEIAKRANSKVVAVFELATYLEKRGTDCVGMNIGGSTNIDGIRISMVEARHSSSIIDEESGRIEYGGEPCGYIFDLSKTLYHAGDTALFYGMKTIREMYKPYLAFLPVGGFYTMDEKAAIMAAKYLEIKKLVPIHYNTFDAIKTDLSTLRRKLDKSTELIVPEVGQYFVI